MNTEELIAQEQAYDALWNSNATIPDWQPQRHVVFGGRCHLTCDICGNNECCLDSGHTGQCRCRVCD